jgi:hypothetical protein
LYGETPRRIREKLQRGALLDAALHILDLKLLAPLWKAKARSSPPGTFWINLEPRVLAGSEYAIDADAVHLARLSDLIWWFQKNSGNILVRSDKMRGVPPELLKHNCYVLVRKAI